MRYVQPELGGNKGIVQCYYDPLPTNCVATEFCAGGSGAGYPRFAHSNGAEYDYKNLAVFYGACSFNCLFCQNWQYRELTRSSEPTMSAKELAGCVDEKTSCICFFGGDPSPQMPHALETSRIALEKAKGILRICWESNGNMSTDSMKKAAALSFESGGTIKFASTLLVPGYVCVEEVENIARFIARLNPDIPYSLLAFYPQFYMNDLPTTSRKEAMECMDAARKYLKRVRIGNIHLLS